MKTAIILTAGSCALVASRSYCENTPTYSSTDQAGKVWTCADFQDDYGADNTAHCAVWGSTPNVGSTSTVAGLTPNMACHACGECDWAPGWTIASSSGPEACHILDDGCIADDAAGSSAVNYANDEKCIFKYTGDATIMFAGNANGDGSHLEMHDTNSLQDDYVAIQGYQGDGYVHTNHGAFTGTWDYGGVLNTGTKTYIFKSDSDNYVAGGFKICDGSGGAATAACPPGKVQGAGGSCEPCGIGTYSWRENSQSCETCAAYPTNAIWNYQISTLQTDASCPWACPVGFVSSSKFIANEWQYACLVKIDNCATQDDSTTCTQCATGYSLAHFDSSTTCSVTPDAGTDMSLNKNAHSKTFCAEGYKLVSSATGTAHASYDTGAGTADDGLTGADATTFKTCEKCPDNESSAGGTSTSCHTINDAWTTCTHMGCELENVATKACAYHSSTNPKTDLAADPAIAIVETKCHDWTNTVVQRIKVFHHGHEQAGTSHKCKLTGAKATPSDTSYATDITRACECECKTTTVSAQDDQQAAKQSKDTEYAARATAQELHTAAHRSGDDGEHPYSSSTDGNSAAQQHAGTPY
jgi:hypothetical protein